MASDFENIRSNLQGHEPEKSSGQAGFIAALVGVIAIGGLVGFMIMPKSTTSPERSETATAPKPQAEKKLSKSDLKRMRSAELDKFRTTQATLVQCVKSQPSMASVYQAYVARNQSRQQAWFKLDSPVDRLNKLAKMNQLEATAYMMTQGGKAHRDIVEDIHREIGAANVKIDPIKCGQLNSKVQRRELDLKPVPNA